jgi:putative ABC transport system permease protein
VNLRALEGGALRLYRGVLWLYPGEFRAAYGHELCLFFLDRCREERSSAGVLGVWPAAAYGVVSQAPREHWAMILQDLRYAARRLRHDALTSSAAVAILALGIGATTLVFSLINGLMIRPLPYPHLDRLVAVEEWDPKDANEAKRVSFLNYLDLRARAHRIDDLGVYESGSVALRDGGEGAIVASATVTDAVFGALGVRPLLGRTFTTAESTFHGPQVAVIGENLWRRRYGAAPRILGRVLHIDDLHCTIVGVMPASFSFPERAQIWTPIQMDPSEPHARTSYHLRAVARLHPGVGVAAATAELQSLLAGIHRENPASNNGYQVRAVPYHEFMTGDYRRPVLLLLIAVALLLLIACANVSYLLLVKASARGREMAVRTAIGATRARLIRQLLVEGLLLALAGGALGVVLAAMGTKALVALIPIQLPLWMDFSLDLRVLALALGLSLATTLLFGLVPAFVSFDRNVAEAVKDGPGGGTRRRHRRLRNVLVMTEVALSFMLLAGAGLAIRSFLALRTQSLGYQPEHVVDLSLAIPEDRYPAGPRYRALQFEVRRAVASLPGVRDVAFTSGVPVNDGWTRIFTIEGRPLPLEKMPSVNHIVTTPEYFHALGIPLLEGRLFNEGDWDRPLLIVTRTFAHQFWPRERVLGKRVRFGPPTANEQWYTVVGVVADSLHGELRDHQHTNVYLPYNNRFASSELVVRCSGNPEQLIPGLKRQVMSVDRDLAMNRGYTLVELLDLDAWRDRFIAFLFAGFAVLALVLAAGGLYAALAYTVALQTHEIGIRMALGASAARVRSMVMRQGATVLLAGLAIGLAAALALTRMVAGELYAISAVDPLAYTLSAAVLLAAGLAATSLPTRRATQIAPAVALRQGAGGPSGRPSRSR